MRVVVMLRPTNRRGTRGEYTAYRKRLESYGFVLLQPEVYIRAVPSRKVAIRCVRALEEGVPSTGAVCVFCMTEKQYGDVRYLVGERSFEETRVGMNVMVEL